MFFGGNPTPGRCAATGAGHDATGSGDYLLDTEGPQAPPSGQTGWRWCRVCEGMFYAGSGLGLCPAGGTHTSEGSWAYVVKMGATTAVAAPLAEVRLRAPTTAFLRMIVSESPIFPADQEAALQGSPLTGVHSTDGRTWCDLAAWLGLPIALEAVVVCRRNGLTVRIKPGEGAQPDPSAQLLPLSAGSPHATLKYRTAGPGAAEERRVHMEAVLDTSGRFVQMLLPFPDDQAGAAQYGEVFGAMTASGSTAAVELRFDHEAIVQAPPGTTGDGPVVDFPGGWWPGWPHINNPFFARSGVASKAFRATDLAAAAAPTRGLEDDLGAVRAFRATPVATEAVLRAPGAGGEGALEAIRTTSDFRRFFVPPEVMVADPGQAQTAHQANVSHEFSCGVARPQSDITAYPDLPRQANLGWGEVPGRAQKRKQRLYFRDSPRPDSFFYLPTSFHLGFYREAEGGGVRPPLRVSLFADEDGAFKVQATLVAIPYIEDADREEIRTYLRDVVLVRTLPYVGLEPKAGLEATFVQDFTVDAGGGQQGLPASIQVKALDVVPHERILLEFTMDAWDYAIFGSLLQKGLTGRVSLTEPGVQASIPVRLHLDDLVTNALRIRGEGFGDEPGGGPGEGAGGGGSVGDAGMPPPPQAPEVGITVGNLLGHPVKVSSLRVSLLDRGPVEGMVFDAEDIDLLPGGRRLAAKGKDGAKVTLPVTPSSIALWDDTVVVPGVLSVDAGSPEEWLDRVNRDPSLQPHEFSVAVTLSIPQGGADRLQLVTAKVFRDGDPAIRDQRQILPASGPYSLTVRMSLAELMGQGGKRPGFSLEYVSVYADGTLSLPQRVALDPDASTLIIPVLAELPDSVYTVDSTDGRTTLARPGAMRVITRLRNEGKHWNIYSSVRPPQPVEDTPDTDGDTTDGATGDGTTGDDGMPDTETAEVTVVADLLAEPFRLGQLSKVFVELQPDDDQAPSSTLRFDPQHGGDQMWGPAAGSIPPFRYRVTYVYPTGAPAEDEGTKADLLLVLDPPAQPAQPAPPGP
jgi:hypothetical protein